MTLSTIRIKSGDDVIKARQAGRELVRQVGFGSADQTRLATAISELARNVIQYAGEGICKISIISELQKKGVRVVVEDNGPGIADIKQAMRRGFSSGNGLGAGLPGAKRLVSSFAIESKPGCTRIVIELTKRKTESVI